MLPVGKDPSTLMKLVIAKRGQKSELGDIGVGILIGAPTDPQVPSEAMGSKGEQKDQVGTPRAPLGETSHWQITLCQYHSFFGIRCQQGTRRREAKSGSTKVNDVPNDDSRWHENATGFGGKFKGRSQAGPTPQGKLWWEKVTRGLNVPPEPPEIYMYGGRGCVAV